MINGLVYCTVLTFSKALPVMDAKTEPVLITTKISLVSIFLKCNELPSSPPVHEQLAHVFVSHILKVEMQGSAIYVLVPVKDPSSGKMKSLQPDALFMRWKDEVDSS